MRRPRLSLSLLLVLAACSDPTPPSTPAEPSEPAPPAEPAAPAVTDAAATPVADSETWNWRCGDQDAVFARDGDAYTLAIAGETIAMRAVEAASGNKHVGADDPTIVFWSKGDEAMLERPGRGSLDCVLVDDAGAAADADGDDAAAAGEGDDDDDDDATMAASDDAGADADDEPALDPSAWIGIDWTIREAGSATVADGAGATVRFEAGGTIAGNSGCNRFTGGYNVEDGVIVVSPLAVTRMACPPAQMELESDVLAVLSGDVEVSLREDGSLQLDGPGGRLVAAR